MRNITTTIWHNELTETPQKGRPFIIDGPKIKAYKRITKTTVIDGPWAYLDDVVRAAKRGDRLRIAQSKYMVRNADEINEKQKKTYRERKYGAGSKSI